MRAFLTASLISLACVGYAQGIDSTKTKLATPLPKYQQPSRSGATSLMVAPRPTSSVPTFSNPSQSRVQSTPTYENGRIIGGSTTWKLGKKKD